MKTPNFARLTLLFALWMIFEPSTVQAQTEDYDKFSIGLGVFFADRETDTRFDSSSGDFGSNVDLEEELGLSKSDSVFRIDGYYRFAPKHQVNFSAFDLSRSASRQIQVQVNWQDTVFPIDTVLNSDFDLAIYKIDYTWRFLQRDNSYLGLTGGLYIADFSINVFDHLTSRFGLSDATAPLPVIGLRGEYEFSEKWSFRANAEFFFFEYGDWDGSLYDIYAGVDYDLFKNMGIGIGVNSVKMNLGVTKPDLTGDLNVEYSGALVFIKFDF
jgi:hypothetical protein